MSDYINGFEMILKKAVEFYQQPEEIAFPDSEKLEDIYKVKPPDLTASFQDGMDIYRSMGKNTPESRKLIHAAVCFDIAYEVPPLEICKAVIKMLILSGNYVAACCYALECLTVSEVQRLMFEHMPLSRDGSYHISHLMLPCWEPEAELAVIMRELRRSKQGERKSLIQSLLYSQGELKDKPQSLLEAVCAFLYVEMCKEKTEEQIKSINEQVKGREYIEIVEILLRFCYSFVNADYYRVSRSESCSEWDSRREKFNRHYSDRIKKGFFIYHPGMRGAVVLHIRLGSAYELSETETALARTDLHISLNQNLILKADYTKHRGKLRLLNPEDIKFDEMSKIAERLRVLIKIGVSQELKSYYQAFINCYEIQYTLESADQYRLFAGDMEKLLNIFNRYTQIKWHNREHALEMMRFLVKRGENCLLEKNYMTFFRYYMRIKAYNEAEEFLDQYRNKLGENNYLQAFAQLQNKPHNSKNSNIFSRKPMVKMKWHPLQLGEGYGNYVTCFLGKGEELLAKRRGNPDYMNENELCEEHDRIIQLGDESSGNPVEAAEYFLMAGAVLNKRREKFRSIDMNEMFAEDMIDAFYHYSRNEMNQLNIDHDVMQSYQEQALHLSRQLHQGYLNNSLKNMFEEMLKRYFKNRPGHDNNSLSEAVRYMAQTTTVTDEEFGSCLMRLSLYYPDFLMRTDITKLLQTNEEVKRRLTAYMQFLDWTPNTDAEMRVVLQEYRNQLVEEFNNCDFIRRIDNPEEQKEELKNGYTQLQDFKGRRKLYCVLSKSDRDYVEKLMELLKNLPEDGAGYITIRKYKKECTRLCEEIKQRPTSFAVEHLHAFALILEEYSEQKRSVLYEKLTPEFSADTLFAESNSQGNDWIRIYLKIECSGGMSGLRDVFVRVFGSEYVLEGGEYSICSYVEENGKEYGSFPIQLVKPEEVQESLSFKVEFKFMIEKTREKKSAIKKLDVAMENLTLSENYEQMYNPGSALYEGHTMGKYTFCGRSSLIKRICRRFYDFPNSMVVLYGQRKVGKTTIANYVASSIKKSGKKILVVNCGNSNINLYNKGKKDCTEEIVQDFYANILECIASEIERDNRYGRYLQNEIIEMKEASDKKNRMNVMRTFSGLIRRLHDAFGREECWRGTHILLWFDEFQRYYLSILDGRLQPEFVGFLKAFIEQYNFSFLLVGCEPMIPFIQDIKFGNTFSAAEQIYVEYLPVEYAKELICDPIPRKSGRENPFRFVVDEIYRLSSGSPYFIQLICRNLIDDLNEKKKVFADKEMILDSLHKEGKVKQNNFDSLFASLNFQASSPEDNNRVLKRIAYRQKERTGSTRKRIIGDLENITEKPTETVLDELVSRKVIEESNGELRIVVRLYEEWIWENRIELGYDELPEL